MIKANVTGHFSVKQSLFLKLGVISIFVIVVPVIEVFVTYPLLEQNPRRLGFKDAKV